MFVTCGAPMTLMVKGLIMMMMMIKAMSYCAEIDSRCTPKYVNRVT